MKKLIIIFILLFCFIGSVSAATHRIPILGWATVPEGSGDVFFEPFDVKATNDVWDRLIVIFTDTSERDALHGSFTVPQNYVSGADVVIVWTVVASTGNAVEWDFDYRAVGGNDAESFDQSGTQQSVNAADTGPSAAFERMEITIALTDGNFASGDNVSFTIFRDGTDAGDTIAASVLLFEVYFEYDDA